MKTFKQLTVGDPIYFVKKGYSSFKIEYVSEVKSYEIYINYSYVKREDKTRLVNDDKYGSTYLLFTVKSEAIRYCKSRMMKDLFSLIDSAKKAINNVKEFRQNNYELLNHNWTEEQINILEKQERNL